MGAGGGDRREFIYAELVSTEGTYVEDLELIIYDYKQPSAEASGLGVGQSFWDTVFGNVEDIHYTSYYLFESLQNSDGNVGECFVGFEAYFDAYVSYCTNYKAASELLRDETERNPALTAWLDARQRATGKGLGLTSYLIKPLQRLLKYPLLLKDLIKCTDPADPDHPLLVQALAFVERLANDINEAQREQDLVAEIWQRMEGIPRALTPAKCGAFLMEVDATEHDGYKHKSRHLLIFERAVVVCKDQSRSLHGKRPLLFRYALSTKHMQIRSLERPDNAWEARVGNDVRVFSHYTAKTRDKVLSLVMVQLAKATFADMATSPRASTVPANVDFAEIPLEEEEWDESIDEDGAVSLVEWMEQAMPEDLEAELQQKRIALAAGEKKRDGLSKLMETYTQHPELGSADAVSQLQRELDDISGRMGTLQADIDALEWKLSPTQAQAAAALETDVKQGTILYAFEARGGADSGELTVAEGERVTVESQDDEWAYCTVDRGGEFVSGYVPTSYVSIAEPELLKPAPAKMTREPSHEPDDNWIETKRQEAIDRERNHAQQRTELLQKHDEQHRDNPIIIPRVLRPRRASATQSTVSTNSRLLEQLERLRTAQEKRSTGIRSPTHADPGSASRPALQPRRVMVAPSKHQVYVHNQQEKKGRLQPRSASLLLEPTTMSGRKSPNAPGQSTGPPLPPRASGSSQPQRVGPALPPRTASPTQSSTTSTTSSRVGPARSTGPALPPRTAPIQSTGPPLPPRSGSTQGRTITPTRPSNVINPRRT